MKRWRRIPVLLIVGLLPTLSLADDVRGVERLLCTSAQAVECFAEGDCLNTPPWELDIPQFLEVDLANKRLHTTRASGRNRSTQIDNVEREAGLVFFQGVESEHAFSFVIAEEDGFLSVAVAMDGATVTVFGACTPLPEGENGDEDR